MSRRYDGSFIVLVMITLSVLASGCQTAKTVQATDGSSKEAREALTAVAGAISGKPLTEEEMKELEHQIRTDEEAQSAIKAITGSMGGIAPVVKFCPICSKRYASQIEICPEDQAQLEIVE